MSSLESSGQILDKVDDWESHYQRKDGKPPFHGMVLLARDNPEALDMDCAAMRAILTRDGQVVHEEQGRALRQSSQGPPLEHFGYVDGISNPEFAPLVVRDGGWDASAPLDQVLVPDPFVNGAFGSFLVYRKLEQDVSKFRDLVGHMAQRSGLSQAEAGARLVGRFEDGTPVLGTTIPSGLWPPDNDFTFQDDLAGSGCPLFAHVRKMNPRLDDPHLSPAEQLDRRARRIARRGITYGNREPDLSDAPSKDVGLLFMAFMANIADQFAFIQRAWANDPSFPRTPTNVDPIIGPDATPLGRCFQDRGSSFSWQSAVTMRGGEYFFAPSIPFLHNPQAG
ncbi:MAG: hypothetical protein NTV70_01445 [Acidobacteria bacterium]|nr:hypothetical protein [Acidobacteriota bacterium]